MLIAVLRYEVNSTANMTTMFIMPKGLLREKSFFSLWTPILLFEFCKHSKTNLRKADDYET